MENNESESPAVPSINTSYATTPPPTGGGSSSAKKSMVVILAVVLGVFLFISVMINLMQGLTLMVKSSASSLAGSDTDEFPYFEEVTSWGDGEVKAVRISIDGAIMRGGSPSLLGPGVDMVELALRQIRAAAVEYRSRWGRNLAECRDLSPDR